MKHTAQHKAGMKHIQLYTRFNKKKLPVQENTKGNTTYEKSYSVG